MTIIPDFIESMLKNQNARYLYPICLTPSQLQPTHNIKTDHRNNSFRVIELKVCAEGIGHTESIQEYNPYKLR